MRSERLVKLIAFIFAICCIVAATWPWSCARTDDQRFADDVRLRISASDRYDHAKTIFELHFSTIGKVDIWPGRSSRLVLFVDGEKKQLPAQASHWNYRVIVDHILPDRPRTAGWSMTLPELSDWIGPGEHELQFQFRNVESNVLKVNVPAEGTNGRVKCDPELDVPWWTKVR